MYFGSSPVALDSSMYILASGSSASSTDFCVAASAPSHITTMLGHSLMSVPAASAPSAMSPTAGGAQPWATTASTPAETLPRALALTTWPSGPTTTKQGMPFTPNLELS